MTRDYLPALQALLPRGAAWTRAPSAVLTDLLDALAQEFGRVEDKAAELIEEADPRTTSDMLADWERVVGLPDDCSAPTTIAGRMAALLAKLTGRGGQHEAFYVALSADAGYTVTIERNPYQPFTSGSAVGDALTNDEWQFVFRVVTESGDEDTLLECVIRANAQGHTYVEFNYGGGLVEITSTVTTTDATITEIASIPMEDEDVTRVEAIVTARERSGGDRSLYRIEGLFYREGASAAQQGSTAAVITAIESDATYDATFAVDGANISIRVTGKAATTIDWKAHYNYMILQSEA